MANYTQGDTRPVLQPADLAPYQTNGSLVLDSRRTRPLWFDGRFLAARDFAREQNYFLQREADLARAPGFGAIDGLLVNSASSPGQAGGATAITIQAGRGVTPAGEIVRVPGDLTVQLADLTETASLDVQFGVSAVQVSSPATRTGLYVVALQPVQFTANPITAYPTTVQGSRSTHDGDMVEATAIVLVPYPGPSNNNGATTLQAALARQTFATGNPGSLSDSLLPLAMLSLQGGAIDWLDPYLVRRDMGVEYTGLRFGLTDPATQQAFLLQYDTQLQQAVNSFTRQKLPASFAATDYFQALPPAGRLPLASVSTDGFTQKYFPPQMDVRLSVVPEDELPALIAESMSLPPIDLTLDPGVYANMTVFVLVPVPRAGFASFAASLPTLPVTTVLPQVLSNRKPIDLLQFYRGASGTVQPSGTDNSSWQAAFGTQTYGYYVRRGSSGTVVSFRVQPPVPQITGVVPSSVVAGGPDLALEIDGINLSNEMNVYWDAPPATPPGTPPSVHLSAGFYNPTLIKATVPASLIANAGSISIAGWDGFHYSNAVPFTVLPPAVITGISPNSASTCDPDTQVTVTGTGFTAGISVTWNGTNLPTTFVSATQLTATVAASLLFSPGQFAVGISGTGATPLYFTFKVNASFVLSKVSLTNPTIIGQDTAITLNGCGFTAATQVFWNGNLIANPTFLSANQMTATIVAPYVGPGTFAVLVKNGTISSNAINVTIVSPSITTTPPPVVTPPGLGTITVPPVTTTVPPIITTVPPVTTVAPPAITVVPPATTTPTTTVKPITTTPPGITTLKPPITDK
jgi:hypothetical protein